MGGRSVANPLGDNAPTSAAASDLAQALRGLKDGSLSELETVHALEQHFEEKYRLRPRLEDAMGSFFSHLTAAPANWHQCTIWCLGSPHAEDAALRQRGPWLYAVSCAMVLLQTATVAGLFMGTVSKSCMTNDDCDRGLFCLTGWTGRCDGCGDRPPFVFEVEGRVLVSPADDPAFPGWNLTAVNVVCASPTGHATVSAGGSIIQYDSHTTSSWCAACVSIATGVVDSRTGRSHIAAQLALMGTFDVIALFFATVFIGIGIVGELNDIILCNVAIETLELSSNWNASLRALGVVRRFTFLPVLVMTVPVLVMHHGGDALTVCLNTVALLFLCEVDNLFFAIFLDERVRVRMETCGRVKVENEIAAALAFSKPLHVVLVVGAVLGCIISGNQWLAWPTSYSAFWVGAVAEALGPGGGGGRQVGAATGSALLGLAGYVVLMVVGFQLWTGV